MSSGARKYLPIDPMLLVHMGEMTEMLERLRYGSILEENLKELEGLQVHFPVFGTEAEQELRQRPDYGELLIEFYDDPRPIEPPVEHDMISYEIMEVKVDEWASMFYKLKRALNRCDFGGGIQLELDLNVDRFDSSKFTTNPQYQDLDLRVQFSRDGTELSVAYYPLEDKHDFFVNLSSLNQLLSTSMSMPDTISELREETAKWEAYNRFKERAR